MEYSYLIKILRGNKNGKIIKNFNNFRGNNFSRCCIQSLERKKDLEEENEELYDEISLLKGKDIEKDLEDGIMMSEDETFE